MNTLPLLLLVASAAWSSVLVSATRKEDLDAKMAEVFNSRRTSVPPPGGYVTKERSDRREREQSVDPAEEMTRHDMQKLKWWKDVKPSRLKSR